MARLRQYGSLLMLGILAWPAMRDWLEASISGHMLVQIPLLALAGAGLVTLLPDPVRLGIARMNPHGVPGFLLAAATLSLWWLPRHLDAALEAGIVELAKFLSVPVLGGLPMALSWPGLPVVFRGLVWCNVISMLLVMAWLYSVMPTRLCNRYLLSDQQQIAGILLGLAAVLSFLLLLRSFYRHAHAQPGCASNQPGIP